MKPIVRFLTLLLVAGCATVRPGAVEDVERTLDAWHQAAAAGDESTYFGTPADDAIFLGTDATQRWTRDAFEADMMRYFERDSAWTYLPVERHVSLSPGGDVAWFDETLENASYGECRGTGVLRLEKGGWKIVQYNLTIPIPNEIAGEVVSMIRQRQ